ncbi:cache domain-containing sensor histidine kinase [Candidatus Pristimantibacillus sp. PTI5]|uniref:cache domain-containing sensor histidine kinase n=1 Tax=Candidatus Pristimantibacillus sp. PTI5 TaxID=3400422 RepID=UPI003B01880A
MIFKWWKAIYAWNSRLSSKLIIVYCLLTVIPISLLGAISYIQYTKSIEEQIGEYMPRFLNQANATIAKHMEEFSEVPSLLFNSDTIISILRHDAYQSSSNYNQEQFTVNSYLARTYLENGNPDVLGVFLISKNRLFYSTRIGFKGLNGNDALIPYGNDLELRGNAKVLLPNELSLTFDNGHPYLLIMKQVQDVDNRKSLGTMLVAVQLDFIDKILRQFENNEKADLWLMNRMGEIIYHTDNEKIGEIDSELPKYPLLNGSFRKGSGREGVITSISESGIYDWILVHSIPMKYLTERTDWIRNVTIFMFFCIVLITSALSISLSLKLTRPLVKLSRLMRQVELGRFQVDLNIQTKDEIGMLARSFNSMISTIRDLIEKNFEIRLRQKESELYALQSQINPHFMYNTLETINMAVEEGKSKTVVEMVTLLGRMLRFSVSNSSKFVHISEEVQHMNDFLTIQKIRFKDRLFVETTQKTEMDSYYTPKFILQPIVENAVKYGLETRKRLSIHVVIGRELGARSGEEDMVFRIRDDGPGISHERLEELERSLRSNTLVAKDSEFGLSNVNARIVMMLGNDYGLQLHSAQGQGTEIIIRIPILSEVDLPVMINEKGADENGEI